ncbi:MAG: hypothetical protein ABSA15_05000 [Thermoplasmata archaeon]|jgi:hypothetical protein
MTENTTTYRYQPNATAIVDRDPPRAVAVTAPMPTPTVVTALDGRRDLSSGMKELWGKSPALLGVRDELERVGRDVEAPAFREVADRTGFGREMRAEARRLGLSKLLAGIWGTSK